MTSLRDRLLAKAVINPDTGCWEWSGYRNNGGYGGIKVGGRAGRIVSAHRLSYEMTYGPIPEGLTLDHLCRVRNCINPAHLEAVTMRVNLLRGHTIAAASAAKTHCPQRHPYDEENTYLYQGRRYCRACRSGKAAA